MFETDVLVIGAGAAGLMCAIEAARRGRRVLVLEHNKKPAEKVRISGGGRCNFTHLKTTASNFLSDNPRFCISALKRYTPQDFVTRIESADIAWEEKSEGQLFCQNSATDIIDMLLTDLKDAGGQLWLGVRVLSESSTEQGFVLETTRLAVRCQSLVVATGGLSIPKMGASNYAYEIAKRFGHTIIKPRPGLVPFVLEGDRLEAIAELSGVSISAKATYGKISFEDGLLFTHRGLSGPAALQISSYWQPGQPLSLNLCPDLNVAEGIKYKRENQPKQALHNAMAELLPRRLSDRILQWLELEPDQKLADLSKVKMAALSQTLNDWKLTPDTTEGYRTAEVTVGGIDTRELSSQTMQSEKQQGLYFIGECVDVTGWLGGYNFQWAWSSGWAAGQAV